MALAALIVAVVAATVALLSFVWTIGWSVWQHRRLANPHVKLQAFFAILPNRPGFNGLSLTATNVGHVTVTITSARIVVAGVKRHLALVTWTLQTPGPLPIVLEPGRAWDGIVDADEIQRGLATLGASHPRAKVRAVVKDAAGGEYASGVIPFS